MNKTLKKTLSIILTILMIATTIPMAFAADIVDSGTFGADGDNLTWMFDSDGVLTISGEGAMGMKDISTTLESDYPWYAYASSINTVIINEGVTKIGNSAFYDYVNLSSVSLPNSLTYIDDFAFRGCSKLKEIVLPIGVTYIGWNVFRLCYGLEDVVMSYTMEKIDSYAFGNEINIKTVHYLGTEEQWDKINFIDDGSGNEILINAERHYCEEKAEMPATCTANGLTKGWYCATCKEDIVVQEVIPDLGGHINEDGDTACDRCGETILCEDCGRPAHDDTFAQNLICFIVKLINLIKSLF